MLGVGFDDVAQAGLSVPSLTTVRQPMEAMGSLSVGMVLDAIKAMDQKQDVPVVRRKIPAELWLENDADVEVAASEFAWVCYFAAGAKASGGSR